MFKIKPQHLEYLQITVEDFGIAYLHGDGNIFVDKESSDYRKNWSSPSSKGSEYVLVFKKGDLLPASTEELMQAFYKEKETEQRRAFEPVAEKKAKSLRTKNKK
jgi:hypothetical protein